MTLDEAMEAFTRPPLDRVQIHGDLKIAGREDEVIGVGAVVAVLAVAEGARSSVEARIRSLGSNLLVVRPARGRALEHLQHLQPPAVLLDVHPHALELAAHRLAEPPRLARSQVVGERVVERVAAGSRGQMEDSILPGQRSGVERPWTRRGDRLVHRSGDRAPGASHDGRHPAHLNRRSGRRPAAACRPR